VHRRIADKLIREPVEDFRLDFEDGYGNRPDAEEDTCAIGAAEAVAKGMADDTLPPFIGIRIKPFSPELFPRATCRRSSAFVSSRSALSCFPGLAARSTCSSRRF